MSEVDMTKTNITVKVVEGLCEAEMKVLKEYHHAGRTDASEFLIRSSMPRLDCKNASIPYRDCGQDMFHRGDVVVVNDNLGHYRGEVEVILKDIPNDGERNLVGRIPKEEMMILDLMEANPDHFWDFLIR